MSGNRMMQLDYDGSGGSQRGSMMSSETSESGRMISGQRRCLPKHQRPLTRYLPIMSADLDLRLHIESAGHQVTLCPHVIIDSFSCRGYDNEKNFSRFFAFSLSFCLFHFKISLKFVSIYKKLNCFRNFRYLHKLGATFHGWSKRWFVLDRQKMALIYYSDKSERKPRGGAYFSVRFKLSNSCEFIIKYRNFNAMSTEISNCHRFNL